jgi:hypothetical protein
LAVTLALALAGAALAVSDNSHVKQSKTAVFLNNFMSSFQYIAAPRQAPPPPAFYLKA